MPAQSLASARLSELCVWVTLAARGSQIVRVALPQLSLEDARPGVAASRALVLTTAHVTSGVDGVHAVGGTAAWGHAVYWAAALRLVRSAAHLTARRSASCAMLWLLCLQGAAASSQAREPLPSLLALEYRSLVDAAHGAPGGPQPPPARTALQLRLQKPTLVLDLAFLIPLADFFTSNGPAGQSTVSTQPAAVGEVLLGAEVHMAQVRGARLLVAYVLGPCCSTLWTTSRAAHAAHPGRPVPEPRGPAAG